MPKPLPVRVRVAALVCLAFLLPSVPAAAQHEHHGSSQPPVDGWSYSYDWNLFFGRNEQIRQFLDDGAWESQNWAMLGAAHRKGDHAFSFHTMISLEPFTLEDRGSPQLFQTGETYLGQPLVNFQHPHDLLMGLGATYAFRSGRRGFTAGADLVGEATLGPVAFMHRASARDNPQVPLVHHMLDSTHITPGVLRTGLELGDWVLEGSVFRGREPDEDRLAIEQPGLDSWAGRIRWKRGSWEAQFSGGYLRQPESLEPFDETRLTASLSYDGSLAGKRLAATMAWGQNRHHNAFDDKANGFLFEGNYEVAGRSTMYGRVELVGKDLFSHPPTPGDVHPHFFYDVNAFTAGFVQDLLVTVAGRFGLGADVTFYRMAPELELFYDSSRSFHFFLRWRRL